MSVKMGVGRLDLFYRGMNGGGGTDDVLVDINGDVSPGRHLSDIKTGNLVYEFGENDTGHYKNENGSEKKDEERETKTKRVMKKVMKTGMRRVIKRRK